MKPEDKAQWVCALRSGDFKQGKTLLYSPASQRYCCLGVLADLHDLLDERGLIGTYSYSLSEQALHKLGLTRREQGQLVEMNDLHRKTFPEIADWIEGNL